MKKLLFVVIAVIMITSAKAQDEFHGFKNPHRGNLSKKEFVEAFTVLFKTGDSVRIRYYWNAQGKFTYADIKREYKTHLEVVYGKIFSDDDVVALAERSTLRKPNGNFSDKEIARFSSKTGKVDWNFIRNPKPGEELANADGYDWSSTACSNMFRNKPIPDNIGYTPQPTAPTPTAAQPQVVYVQQQPQQVAIQQQPQVVYVVQQQPQNLNQGFGTVVVLGSPQMNYGSCNTACAPVWYPQQQMCTPPIMGCNTGFYGGQRSGVRLNVNLNLNAGGGRQQQSGGGQTYTPTVRDWGNSGTTQTTQTTNTRRNWGNSGNTTVRN